jgi:hypothetical protein
LSNPFSGILLSNIIPSSQRKAILGGTINGDLLSRSW